LDMKLREEAGEPAGPSDEQGKLRRRGLSLGAGERLLCRGEAGGKEACGPDLDTQRGHRHSRPVPTALADTTALTLLPPKPKAFTRTLWSGAGVSVRTTEMPRLGSTGSQRRVAGIS